MSCYFAAHKPCPMSRSAAYFLLLLLVWLLTPGLCAAQVVPLQLIPDRMRYAREVEQKALKAHDSLGLAEAWYLYGKTYVLAGDYHTAHTYFMKAMRVHEPRGDSFELSRLYVRLAENEERLGRFHEAKQFAQRSLQIAQRTRSDKALIRSYGVLGSLAAHRWHNGNRPDSLNILTFFGLEEQLCQKLKDTLGLAEARMHIGSFLSYANQRQGIPYLQDAVFIFRQKNKDGILINALIELATAYLRLGQKKQALINLLDAQKIYSQKSLSSYSILLGMEQCFVDYYTETNDWKRALEHTNKLTTLQQGQLLANNEGAISRLNIEYETEKKEATLRTQTTELAALRLQKWFALLVSILLLITAGSSVIFFQLYRKNKRTSRRNEELVKEQNHRVKNNLQVVSSLLSMQSKRLVDETAKKAINESRLRVQSMAILHQYLYEGEQLTAIDLAEFIPELVNGVLQSYGYPTLQPAFDIDPINLAADRAVPLGLIINELTTNACKYAFPEIKNGLPDYIISCKWNKQQIRLTVADNGPGIEQVNKETNGQKQANGKSTQTIQPVVSRSFGMQLIQAQVEQLRGTYQFRTGEAEGDRGTTFMLTINA